MPLLHVPSLLVMRAPFDTEPPNLTCWHICGGPVFEWSATPHPKGRGPSTTQICGSSIFMRTNCVAEIQNFTWYQIWGHGLF